MSYGRKNFSGAEFTQLMDALSAYWSDSNPVPNRNRLRKNWSS